MGMLEETTFPDTFGLPEFYITEVKTEVAGTNVRMVCGAKRGGVVHWLYSCVMPAELLLPTTRECALVACEAFNLGQLVLEHGKGH